MSESDVPGLRPDKAIILCAGCGHHYKNKHMSIPPNARIPVDCPECPSGGTVMHNQYSYVSGSYGAVEVLDPEENPEIAEDLS